MAASAQELNDLGHELSAKGWYLEAERAYRDAAAAAPTWSVPWYNLGLMQKYRGEWAASMECNLRATNLAPSDEAAWWNLGIAATALGHWDQARLAWKKCGISVPEGDGPIEMDLGSVPIRLNGRAEGEVVWATRIDPARAVLLNVPLPDSGHRWRDLVLHDGAANGHRMLRGREVPVFDSLHRLQPSPYRTFVVEVDGGPDAMEMLSTVADDLGGAAEDWSTSTRILCTECSEGTPGHLHDVDRSSPACPSAGVAARDQHHLDEILATWRRGSENVHIHSVHEVPVDAAEQGVAADGASPRR
jgi:hypothetical protein